MLNHLPVIGVAFSLALLAWSLWRKNEVLKKTALGALTLVALLSIPAYVTGEPSEDAVKSLPGVSASLLEQHEEVAMVAFTMILGLGGMALAALLWFRRGKLIPAWFGYALLLVSLMVSGMMAWTANLGGQIRHSEIRANAAQPASHGDRD